MGRNVNEVKGDKGNAKGGGKGGGKFTKSYRSSSKGVETSLEPHVGAKRKGEPMDIDGQKGEVLKKAKTAGENITEGEARLSKRPYKTQ